MNKLFSIDNYVNSQKSLGLRGDADLEKVVRMGVDLTEAHIAKNYAEQVKKANYEIFLDIGCGLGRHSIYMAENGFNVYGIDYSNYVIDIVKEKAFLKGLDIKLSVGDISSLPYESESVDCIAAIGVLSNSDKNGISAILK